MKESMKEWFPQSPAQVAAWIAGATIVVVGSIAGVMAGYTGSSEGGSGGTTPALAPRSYHGSASAGDFLEITVTPTSATAGTIRYTDLSNNETGSAIPYTVASDGSYAISDTAGNLVSGYEIPGYAFLIHLGKAGPGENTEALVTAVKRGPATLAGLSGSYNYIRFQTENGGMEIGSLALDAAAQSVVLSGYSPWAAYSGRTAAGFTGKTAPTAIIAQSSDGTYLTSTETGQDGATDTQYLFGASGGYLVLDNPNDSVIGLPQAPESAFSPRYAGAYSGIFYRKTNAAAAVNGTETGAVAVDPVSIAVSSGGALTVTDTATGSRIVTGKLTPVSAARYLYNATAGGLASPCNGMFTFRLTVDGLQQDVFATFLSSGGKNSVLFSSFAAPIGQTGTSGYSYFYGVGLMAPEQP